jgi:hypothetical protein
MPWTDGVRKRARWPVAAGAALLVAGLLLAELLLAPGARAQFWFTAKPLPEFVNQSPAAWINSKPLSKADLAGKVVLIEIWTSI